MKRQENREKLELSNLTPPRANRTDGGGEPPRRSGSSSSSSLLSSTSSSDMSEESSCVLSEARDHTADNPRNTAETALVGCPRCLMYVVLSEVDPKCPRCKSTVLLLDFLKEEEIKYYGKNK